MPLRAQIKALSPLLALAAIYMASTTAIAATYYVDNTPGVGSDTNSGKSMSTPWATCHKVDGTNFLPGDTIRFKRGDVWREQLFASSSGTSGHPITYADYGSGTKPIFFGSDILKDTAFHATSYPNVYSYGPITFKIDYASPDYPAHPDGVLVNHNRGPEGAWLTDFKNVSPPGEFPPQTGEIYYDKTAKLLYIYSDTDPRTDHKVYSVAYRANEIANGPLADAVGDIYTATHDLVFKNLVAAEVSRPDQGYVVRMQGATNVIMDSCEAYNGGKHNFGIINTTGFVGRNLIAGYAAPGLTNVKGLPNRPELTGNSLYVMYDDQKDQEYTGTFSRCVGLASPVDSDPADGYYGYWVSHTNFTPGSAGRQTIVIDDPIDHSGEFAIMSLANDDSGSGIQTAHGSMTVHGGVIADNLLNIYTDHVVVAGVTFTGGAAVDLFNSSGNVVEDCLFDSVDPDRSARASTGYDTAILIRGTPKLGMGNIVRFCTVVISPKSKASCIAWNANRAKTQVYGNIFESGLGPAIDCSNAQAGPTNQDVVNTDYNLYGNNPRFHSPSATLTLSQWRTATSADAHSCSGDPDFRNPPHDDYRLGQVSPAIDGVPIRAEIPPLPRTDISGKPRLSGRAYDMGAYEKTSEH